MNQPPRREVGKIFLPLDRLDLQFDIGSRPFPCLHLLNYNVPEQQEEINFERIEEEKPSLIRKYLDEAVALYVKGNLKDVEKVSALTLFWARMGTVDLSFLPAGTLSWPVGGLSTSGGAAEPGPLQVSAR